MLPKEQIVRVGPVDAADLVDVAEAFGGEERGFGAGALQDGVDRDGRAVQEQPCRAEVAAGLLDALADAVDQALRRRQDLAGGERAGALIEHRDVGEGAVNIGSKADVGTGRVDGAGHTFLIIPGRERSGPTDLTWERVEL